MAAAALGLYLIWALLAFGWRAFLQHRRTGDTGFRGLRRPGTVEWCAGVLFIVAVVAGLAVPVADLTDVLEPIGWLDHGGLRAIGVMLAVAGVAGTLGAQMTMGESWRVGVDPTERTALVTNGPFALARNPIFTMMLLTATGLTAMVPNVLAVGGLVGLVVGLQLQVRLVEEPYLRTIHGRAYTDYAALVGRFVPMLGRHDRDPHLHTDDTTIRSALGASRHRVSPDRSQDDQ
jgi:protein-S-isoprenylcysteine O-methyltransferase Ste14